MAGCVFGQIIHRIIGQGFRIPAPVPEAGETPPGLGVQRQARRRADPDPVVGIHQQGAHVVGGQGRRVAVRMAQVDPGMVRQREDAHAAGPEALDELVPAEREGVQRDVAHPLEGADGIRFEAPAALVQPGHAFGEGADPDGAVRRLLDMGNVIVRQGAFRAVGPEDGPGLRAQVQTGQARLLRRDPEERLFQVRQHTVQLIGGQAVRALQKGPARDAVIAVQAFLRGHPHPVLRIDGEVDDETVGKTDILGGGKDGGQEQAQREKVSAHGMMVFAVQNKHFYDMSDHFDAVFREGLTNLYSEIEQIADLRSEINRVSLLLEFG